MIYFSGEVKDKSLTFSPFNLNAVEETQWEIENLLYDFSLTRDAGRVRLPCTATAFTLIWNQILLAFHLKAAQTDLRSTIKRQFKSKLVSLKTGNYILQQKVYCSIVLIDFRVFVAWL